MVTKREWPDHLNRAGLLFLSHFDTHMKNERREGRVFPEGVTVPLREHNENPLKYSM